MQYTVLLFAASFTPSVDESAQSGLHRNSTIQSVQLRIIQLQRSVKLLTIGSLRSTHGSVTICSCDKFHVVGKHWSWHAMQDKRTIHETKLTWTFCRVCFRRNWRKHEGCLDTDERDKKCEMCGALGTWQKAHCLGSGVRGLANLPSDYRWAVRMLNSANLGSAYSMQNIRKKKTRLYILLIWLKTKTFWGIYFF